MGYRYSPPGHPPSTPPVHYPGYTSPRRARVPVPCRAGAARLNMVVGLKSVGQLSLYAHFSDIEELTEVYNLVRIDNPNDHKDIPGTN